MGSTFMTGLFIFLTIAVIINGVVKIIQASKGARGSKEFQARTDGLGDDLARLEQDLEDARERIVVLEKIVTDDKRNLRQEIDDLANDG